MGEAGRSRGEGDVDMSARKGREEDGGMIKSGTRARGRSREGEDRDAR